VRDIKKKRNKCSTICESLEGKPRLSRLRAANAPQPPSAGERTLANKFVTRNIAFRFASARAGVWLVQINVRRDGPDWCDNMESKDFAFALALNALTGERIRSETLAFNPLSILGCILDSRVADAFLIRHSLSLRRSLK